MCSEKLDSLVPASMTFTTSTRHITYPNVSHPEPRGYSNILIDSSREPLLCGTDSRQEIFAFTTMLTSLSIGSSVIFPARSQEYGVSYAHAKPRSKSLPCVALGPWIGWTLVYTKLLTVQNRVGLGKQYCRLGYTIPDYIRGGMRYGQLQQVQVDEKKVGVCCY